MRRRRAQLVYRKQTVSSDVLDTRKLFQPSQSPNYVQEHSQLPPLLSDRVISATNPSAGNAPLLIYPNLPSRKVQPSPLLRNRLRQISAINVVFTFLISALGYEIIAGQRGKNVLKYVLSGLSALQIGLIVLYTSKQLNWMESVRQELRLSPVAVPSLCESKRAVMLCVLECCFHLVVLPPGVESQWQVHMLGTYCFLSLDDFLYPFILLRNYHFLQYLFWRSALSTRRTSWITTFVNIRLALAFVLRYCMTVYSLVFISSIYLVVIVISGIFVYIFERHSPGTGFDSLVSALWVVAQTQVTVGYGDFTPRTYFGSSAVIISCFAGIFMLALIVSLLSRHMSLSLAESSLYSSIAYAEKKRHRISATVIFLQSWWRFMHMRLHHDMQPCKIINFYYQQGKFKAILQNCQLAKDRRFEWQIQAFQASICSQCRHMSEYLQPVVYSKDLVVTI